MKYMSELDKKKEILNQVLNKGNFEPARQYLKPKSCFVVLMIRDQYLTEEQREFRDKWHEVHGWTPTKFGWWNDGTKQGEENEKWDDGWCLREWETEKVQKMVKEIMSL